MKRGEYLKGRTVKNHLFEVFIINKVGSVVENPKIFFGGNEGYPHMRGVVS